ncbi:MAG: dienelactone hydrolase family protein [Syntrophobacterales bacterium]|nr:dienelactone hydrolase family protein [Syntrophobacterales bacterium]
MADQSFTEEKVTISLGNGEAVSGILLAPEGSKKRKTDVFIIAHGQGNGMQHPLLVTFAEGLAGAGYATLRFNFLFKEGGKEHPDKKDKLFLAWEGAMRFIREESGLKLKRVFASGKSLGGRIAAHMTGEGLLNPDGLVFLGYPLHPMGNPENVRADHFAKIRVPMLFFAGTRDPFCNLLILKKIFSSMDLDMNSRLEVVDGGDHSFEVPKSLYLPTEEIYKHILKKTLQWLGRTFPKQR